MEKNRTKEEEKRKQRKGERTREKKMYSHNTIPLFICCSFIFREYSSLERAQKAKQGGALLIQSVAN